MLAAAARRLNRAAGAPALPALFFLTDPERTPDPEKSVRRLPRGTAVVYRHFGAADRARMARRLAGICRARGLVLLIAADPALALRVGAAGVHWPERLLPTQRDGGFRLVTASAHSLDAVTRAAEAQVDACLLGPIFPTDSTAGNAPIGLFHASQIARSAGLPVIALGGIGGRTVHALAGRGFAGLAAVGALAGA